MVIGPAMDVISSHDLKPKTTQGVKQIGILVQTWCTSSDGPLAAGRSPDNSVDKHAIASARQHPERTRHHTTPQMNKLDRGRLIQQLPPAPAPAAAQRPSNESPQEDAQDPAQELKPQCLDNTTTLMLPCKIIVQTACASP